MKCVGFCRLISHHYPLNCSIMYQVCPASGRRYLLCFDIPIIWMDVQDEITARPYENTQTVTSTTVLPLLLLIMQVLLHLVDFCWIGSWFCKFKDWKECISDFVMHSVGCSCVKMFAFWVGEKNPQYTVHSEVQCMEKPPLSSRAAPVWPSEEMTSGSDFSHMIAFSFFKYLREKRGIPDCFLNLKIKLS